MDTWDFVLSPFSNFWLDLCDQRRVNTKSQRQREIALNMGARMSENISDVFMTVYPFSDDIPFLSDKYRIDSNLNTGVYLKNTYSIVLMETDEQLLEHTKLARGFRLVLPGT